MNERDRASLVRLAVSAGDPKSARADCGSLAPIGDARSRLGFSTENDRDPIGSDVGRKVT